MVKRKSIHFVLSHTKDLDLIAWKNSLRDGEFNRVVNEILIAESEKKIANIPCGSKKVENLQTINSRLLVYDRYAIELIESFGPKEVTSSIKKIIRKHINKNRQTVKHSKDDRYKCIIEILNLFRKKMLEKEKEFSGVANKYQKLCDAYDIAINNLFNELLSCASAPTMNEACNKIRNFNYMDIINETFDQVFEANVKSINNSADEKNYSVSTKDIHHSVDENSQVPKPNEESTINSNEEKEEDVIYKILEYGIPDEIFETIKEKVKENTSNE